MEIWKPVKGYEGIYEVSNKGRVQNSSHYILKPFDNGGYLRVGLTKDKVRKKYLVHKLVAEAFLPSVEGNLEINHKDLNKKNNSSDNLEWVSGSQNVQHYMQNKEGRKEQLQSAMSEIGKKYGHLGAEASKKPVAQIDTQTNQILNIFESGREASRVTGACYKKISAVCRGDRKTHFGYKWRFVSDLKL